ncbi:GGDEF domain-containing protein [Vibrio crassostreae]|uniref:GGDEF domain-containing protein n=1 Tax=Vibrio crassostreae TaxID=246167 RepID=UPI000F4975B1|nr:GGDEF domain-containing protein [Vibrio crassostreae]ROO77091.1 diguanylate cyclase (GGDEF)-like protein [Vibrio crassostreae]ROR75338.1 diguanylate cyclase (GGDEF)-like protein [Vibrio crassostreae]TCV32787.1 diguanylate cyclase (GGDEF)-like protein [Vibrio crassostreae]
MYKNNVRLFTFPGQVMLITLIFSVIFIADLSKRKVDIEHELELTLRSLSLYTNQVFEDTLNTQGGSSNKAKLSFMDDLDVSHFYYRDSLNDLDERQKVIVENTFEKLGKRTNFDEFGLIFPDEEIIIASSPYIDVEEPMLFSDLCKSIKLCTMLYVSENKFFDNAIKFSRSYTWNSQNVIMLYKPVTYDGYTYVYFLKYQLSTNSYFSAKFDFRLGGIDDYSGLQFYIRPKKEFDSIFSIKLKNSLIISDQKISYDTKVPIELILDVRDYIKIIALMSLIFMGLYNLKSKEKNKVNFDKVKVSAARDSLTGVYNRNFFDEFRQNADRHSKFALISIDGNKIKYFNDNYGHKVGDDAIKIIASALKSNFREDDLIFRLGGDEFLVVVVGSCDIGKLDMIIERLHSSLSRSEVLKGQVVSISCGIAFSEEANDFETVLKLSDSRMYEDKVK